MSSSSSTYPQPQVNSTLNIPPDPENIFQSPTTGSNVSSNSHVTFRHVLQHYWRGINHNVASPTPPQIWVAQNVYPLVSPMRILCFIVSIISFMLACGFFMETELYQTRVVSASHHYVIFLVFFVAVLHSLFVIFLLFFSFFTSAYEKFKNHFFLKSLGEFMVMRVMSLLISRIEMKHQDGSSDVAALVTCALIAIDSLCIIMLLKPGHHYSLLDATLTLILHLGLEGEGIYAISADVFVFIMLAIKNFLWHYIGHAHGRDDEQLQLLWFDSHQVDNLSSA